MKHEAKITQILKLVYEEIDHIEKTALTDRTIGDANKLLKYYTLLINDEEDVQFDLSSFLEKITDEQIEKLPDEQLNKLEKLSKRTPLEGE